jgi:hypothetical protein
MIPDEYPGVPIDILIALRDYLNDHREPGGFLCSVLRNDLTMSVKRADPANLCALPQIVDMLLAHCPAPAWGSDKAVRDWLHGPKHSKR